MEILRNILQVSSTGTMLLPLLVLLSQHCLHQAFAQGPEAFFNTSSSYIALNRPLDIRGRTSFSFRTCSSGALLYQEGPGGDFANFTLLPSGALQLSWRSGPSEGSVDVGVGLNDNRWHDVDLVHRLGKLTLAVGKDSVPVPTAGLFEARLDSGHPQLIVGRGFTGCVLQGAGVVLNDSSAYSYEVQWGKCPLPTKSNCDGYGVDHCFSQPCHPNSKCISLPDGYECQCTTRYSGPNCDIDSGPLCNQPQYNQCLNGGTCQEDANGNLTICACPPKYTGSFCETMVDNTFCDLMPCRHGGTCNINQFRNNYVCTCPQGFAGMNCELNIDECQSFPCQNNGSCTDEINSYSCDCSGTGYRGPNCEENINECEEGNPCYTGSQCFDRYGDYMCDCPPGFGGKNCDQEVNECDSSPCQNMGTCIDNLNSYLCRCVQGFAGINCEENIDECAGQICPVNSHCVDGINSFSCVCDAGYEGAVPHCQEIDECAKTPCENEGFCEDLLNGYKCTCRDGFNGTRCEINIDECETDPCRNGGTCVDGAGKYTCECVVGYSGTNCEVDINDCEPNPCRNNANCTDLVNDFICECLPGWEGKTCVDNINECLNDPCLHGQCVDNLNNFTCVCQAGYMGRHCETNINECDSSPCFNGGTCTDLIDDFSCKCPEHFMGKNCDQVYDACGSSPCLNGGTCQTNIPSHEYICICFLGYLGDNCEIDVDDCTGVVCPEGKICIDLQNSYDCRCPIGFTGPTCSINIDECASNPCVNGTCVDGRGNFTCQCPIGLTGALCESDIDECEDSPCLNGICKNMHGSYLCYCTPGYTGTHCDIEFNECLSNPCQNGATCNDLVNAYSCTCVPGFAGNNCETDIDECSSGPCMHGGTCSNLINKYECACMPGYDGINCEVNIDECAPQPCRNGGICIDLINEFQCNCSDTGFSGMYCENNIDDCVPQPCQNGASCEDMIKDYHCSCYEGYNGKNCENDIEDCASSPCMHNGLCLENSNRTLYEMNYLGFFPSFSYEMASGYRCICALGFTGENCETNIDDCEFNDCKNGICIDNINDYFCACHLGYEGKTCSREINECEMLKPCENGAVCVDLVADYRCECLPEFGGKNCDTRKIGCIDVECLNGATCIPLLDDNGNHSHKCQCSQGFYGELCENATTISFKSKSLLSNLSYTQLPEFFKLEFMFRTTLPSGLISSGYIPNMPFGYMLYLWNGMVKADVFLGESQRMELFSIGGQNDAKWKTVTLDFKPNEVILNVSGRATQKHLDFPYQPMSFIVEFGASRISIEPIANIPDFIGCMQDIYVNDAVIIPYKNNVLEGAEEGCPREEQCSSSPCHNGVCMDYWLSYECVCSRPFFGTTCEYSYDAATFGYLNNPSHAELLLNDDVKSSLSNGIDVSFFSRTRNESGLVFYMGSSLDGTGNCSMQNDTSFLMARLVAGQLQVVIKQHDGEIGEVTVVKRLDDGENYFVQVNSNATVLTVKVNDTVQNKAISNSSICMDALYIANLPSQNRLKRQIQPSRFTDNIDILLLDDLSFFKGVIQDFRVNDAEVVFYELNATGDGFPSVFGKANIHYNVMQGVVSDNPCNTSNPCLHGECEDVWNDYVCKCPEDYRGKNCQERKPCADAQCPMDSECRNLDVGYECVASAAFDGLGKRIHYQVNNFHTDFTNISFSFVSKSNGTLLWIDSLSPSTFPHFLHVELSYPMLEVKWDLGPALQNEAFHKTVSQKIEGNETQWHHVQIWFDGTLVHLKVSGNADNLSEDRYFTGLRDLLSNGANVYVGYKPDLPSHFKGCLKDVRIGGALLSFLPDAFPQSNNPFSVIEQDLEIGCKLCWQQDCVNGGCHDDKMNYSCSCREGYEGERCDVDMCDTRNPCHNGGTCSHDEMDALICTCPSQYTGPTCFEDNLCNNSPCRNGGTCLQENKAISCLCPDNYEGPECEKPKTLDCSKVYCNNGTCLNVDLSQNIKFKCLCYDGYDGQFCNKTKDFCASNPCVNGKCSVVTYPNYATFTCDCYKGFTGVHCEENINECEQDPCKHGTCIDMIGEYKCECYPGYKGPRCTDKIRRCTDSFNVCNRGNCTNTEDGYECECPPSFIGYHCSIQDECEPSKCNHKGVCNPSYDEHELMFVHTCLCNDGFSGNDCTKEVARGGEDSNLVIIVLIPVLSLFLLCFLIGAVVFLRMAKKKRATRGTYSPSRQEIFGSRVEMNHVMKPPPEERLI